MSSIASRDFRGPPARWVRSQAVLHMSPPSVHAYSTAAKAGWSINPGHYSPWMPNLEVPNAPVIWVHFKSPTDVFMEYSRRFATATARTASLGSHSRGIETKNIRKYWLSEKKTRRIWWPCIADQRSSKNNEKHEKTAKLLLFTVFLRGEKQKPLQIPWFLRVRWPKTL